MYSQLHTDMEDGNSCVLLLTQVGRLKHELSCKEKKLEQEDGTDPVPTSFPVQGNTVEHVMTTYSLCKNPRNGGKVITAPMFAPGKQESDVILRQQGKLN